MSGWLIASVGIVYGLVAAEQFWKGHVAMGVVWAGYCFSQWGLLVVTLNQK